jgi:hypothetical protein
MSSSPPRKSHVLKSFNGRERTSYILFGFVDLVGLDPKKEYHLMPKGAVKAS